VLAWLPHGPQAQGNLTPLLLTVSAQPGIGSLTENTLKFIWSGKHAEVDLARSGCRSDRPSMRSDHLTWLITGRFRLS
jgi:hypothetical protein